MVSCVKERTRPETRHELDVDLFPTCPHTRLVATVLLEAADHGSDGGANCAAAVVGASGTIVDAGVVKA